MCDINTMENWIGALGNGSHRIVVIIDFVIATGILL